MKNKNGNENAGNPNLGNLKSRIGNRERESRTTMGTMARGWWWCVDSTSPSPSPLSRRGIFCGNCDLTRHKAQIHRGLLLQVRQCTDKRHQAAPICNMNNKNKEQSASCKLNKRQENNNNNNNNNNKRQISSRHIST